MTNLSFSEKLICFLRSSCRKLLALDEKILVFIGLAVWLNLLVSVASYYTDTDSWAFAIKMSKLPKAFAEVIAAFYLFCFLVKKFFERKIK